jgi:hemerythrin superfamily protein
MTFYEPNSSVVPTGEEAAEFIEHPGNPAANLSGGETQDLVDVVLADHDEIRSLFTQFETAPDGQRTDLWTRIVRILAVHETAEEELLHPQVRRYVDGGDDDIDALLTEERAAKRELAGLEKLGPDAAEFADRFSRFRRDVVAHAEHEERDVLPALRATIDGEQLRRLGGAYLLAKRIAPTHGHAIAPTSAVGNFVMGPVVALVDRTRDVIHGMMKARSG